MVIKLPFGKSMLEYDFYNPSVLNSKVGELKSVYGEEEIVRESMKHPIGSERLQKLAQGKRSAAIIISDHTRPVPSKVIIPMMLEELRKGNPDIKITLLVATGFHRSTTEQELIQKLGRKIVQEENIVIHDCRDPGKNCRIGTLPSGAPLIIDRVAAETDLLVSEGFIEPHFFAGFSGGRKSVLPGICDQKTVLGNHCSRFIDSPHARTGILDDNPLQIDMAAAVKSAQLAFIVNVIIDENKKVVASFAGDPLKAHRLGCDYLSKYCCVDAVPSDIIVTTNGGSPLDQNVYQCVKGLTAAESTANRGAVLIMCAACNDGTGSAELYRSLRDCKDPASLYKKIMDTPQDMTEPDQWETQVLARILIKHKVIFVTRPELRQTILDMKMDYAEDIREAMNKACRIMGEHASVCVIPNGISVIIRNTPLL